MCERRETRTELLHKMALQLKEAGMAVTIIGKPGTEVIRAEHPHTTRKTLVVACQCPDGWTFLWSDGGQQSTDEVPAAAEAITAHLTGDAAETDTEAAPVKLRLPGSPSQIGRARNFVAGTLRGHPRLEDACLLTSELATNAVQHTGDDELTITVTSRHTTTRIEVATPTPTATLPTLKPRDPNAETGRGLQILDALTTAWGVIRSRSANRVWFELDATAPT